MRSRTPPHSSGVAFPGDEIFDGLDADDGCRRADVDVAEMEPELARSSLAQRHGDGHALSPSEDSLT